MKNEPLMLWRHITYILLSKYFKRVGHYSNNNDEYGKGRGNLRQAQVRADATHAEDWNRLADKCAIPYQRIR
jgi:hypothetical protein